MVHTANTGTRRATSGPQALKRQSWQVSKAAGQLAGCWPQDRQAGESFPSDFGLPAPSVRWAGVPTHTLVRTSSALACECPSNSSHQGPFPGFAGVAEAALGSVVGSSVTSQEELGLPYLLLPTGSWAQPLCLVWGPSVVSGVCPGPRWVLPARAPPEACLRLSPAARPRLEFRAQRGHFVFLDQSLGSRCRHSCGA